MGLTLYRIPFSTNVERVALALAHKGLDVDWVDVKPDDRGPVVAISGQELVPVLVDGDVVLSDSPVILDYLEERFPEPPLLPPDPGERAVARLLVFRFDDLGKPYYALRRGADDAHERLDDVLTGLDRTLSAMPFLTGRSFGLADVAYVPWLLRLRDLMGFSLDGYATLTAWIERCSERPSVAAEVETLASLAV